MSLLVTFSNERNGFMPITPPNPFRGSKYPWAYEAPISGYGITSNLLEACYVPGEGLFKTSLVNMSQCYFRVRAITNAAGEIVEAYYGKMQNSIDIYPPTSIRFTYYLNPKPNDRNIEFDPGRNLLKNLRDMEKVESP
jgi:hypothetical protein